MRSGIYRIRNVINNKCYIGQSRDVHRRIREHIRLLSRGEHHSSKLQEDYDRFGIGAFRFEVLEYCEPHKLTQKEAEYIKKFNAIRKGYNTQLVIHEPVVSVHKPAEVQKIEIKKEKVLLKIVEKHVVKLDRKQIFKSIAFHSFVFLLTLGYLFNLKVLPGTIVGLGPALFVIISLGFLSISASLKSGELQKAVTISTYIICFSLFYLVFCSYLLWADDPLTEKTNLPIVDVGLAIFVLFVTLPVIFKVLRTIDQYKKKDQLMNQYVQTTKQEKDKVSKKDSRNELNEKAGLFERVMAVLSFFVALYSFPVSIVLLLVNPFTIVTYMLFIMGICSVGMVFSQVYFLGRQLFKTIMVNTFNITMSLLMASVGVYLLLRYGLTNLASIIAMIFLMMACIYFTYTIVSMKNRKNRKVKVDEEDVLDKLIDLDYQINGKIDHFIGKIRKWINEQVYKLLLKLLEFLKNH